MFADPATLEDLEILPSRRVPGMTLWSLVDRTRTRVGREALRGRFLGPTHAIEEIAALQRAHRAVAAEASVYRQRMDRAATDDVESYLNTRWQIPRDMPAFARMRPWYRQYRRDVEQGRAVVASLLEAAAELRDQLAGADAAILTALAEEIGGIMAADVIGRLRAVAFRTRGSVVGFDAIARGEAAPNLIRLLRCIGEIEALWSVAVATTEHGWTYPRPASHLHATGIFHPFLGQNSTTNDVRFSDQVRVCFVTGPNMAGKSTFLKAIAIATFLAHMGAGVPATSMDFVPVGTLFSSVRITDNLSAGESFYLAEVRRIGALATALVDHGSALAVVDEPFRGTNVHDAADATLAVITRLAASPAGLILIASHLGEIAPSIAADRRIALLNFAADVTSDRPRFDYRVRKGVNGQRLGMTLLRQEGVLDRLDRATNTRCGGQ